MPVNARTDLPVFFQRPLRCNIDFSGNIEIFD
jgi:hypothetical protein